MPMTNERKSNVPVQLGAFSSSDMRVSSDIASEVELRKSHELAHMSGKNRADGLRQATCRRVYDRRFLTHKKSQSISINTIIIAALGLAVLVVLFVVFTGRFSKFGEGVKESSLTCEKGCQTVGYKQGFYRPNNREGVGETCIPGKYEDVPEGQVCCCS